MTELALLNVESRVSAVAITIIHISKLRLCQSIYVEVRRYSLAMVGSWVLTSCQPHRVTSGRFRSGSSRGGGERLRTATLSPGVFELGAAGLNDAGNKSTPFSESDGG